MSDRGLLKNYSRILRSTRSFSVEFNNEVIKILQLRKKKDSYEIAGWNKIKLPKDVLNLYEILKPKEFGELFLEAVKGAKGTIRGQCVAISIPENKVFTRLITVPSMDEKEAGEAIKWETESNIPISIDEVYYDWQILEKGEKTMKVLVLASPKKIIDNYISAFSLIDFDVVAFEAESVAMGRSLVGSKNKNSVLIVNVGLENTCYAIYQDSVPIFTSSGFFSGELVTDTISKHFSVPIEKAEGMKVRFGIGTSTKQREEYLPVLEPLVSSLLGEIEKTINFFDENLSNGGKDVIDKVVICGGGSNLKGLIQYLGGKLGKPVVQANPFENTRLNESNIKISNEEIQSFITSIGLELRHCNKTT